MIDLSHGNQYFRRQRTAELALEKLDAPDPLFRARRQGSHAALLFAPVSPLVDFDTCGRCDRFLRFSGEKRADFSGGDAGDQGNLIR